MRPAIALLTGCLIGIAMTLSALMLAGGWYEYHWDSNVVSARDLVNDEGWHIVPNQPNERYLQRPRLRFPR